MKRLSKEIIANENLTRAHEEECEKLQKYLDSSNLNVSNIQKKIDSVPAVIIDIVSLRDQLKNKKYEIKSVAALLSDLNSDREENIATLDKVNNFIDGFDIGELELRKKEYEQHYSQLDQLFSEIKEDKNNISLKQQKIQLLSEVPCGDAFPTCKFIKDAHEAKVSIIADTENLAKIKLQCTELKGVADQYDIEKIEDSIGKYQKILQKKKDIELFLANNKLEIEKNEAVVNKLEHEIEKLQLKVKEYEDNKEAIENIEDLLLE